MREGLDRGVDIVEVGLRDGFQSLEEFVPTEHKIELLRQLYRAGLRRIEVTSFVNPSAVPQLSDAAHVLAAAQELPGLDAHVLVPTVRQADRAFAAGARHIAFVLSVSEWHNRANVRRSPSDSIDEFSRILKIAPKDVTFRVCIATAFDCPHDGRVAHDATLALLDQLIQLSPHAEFVLCDTTGRADPSQVSSLFLSGKTRFPSTARWGFHGHDTYGLGTTNVLAAWQAGVVSMDASIAGLGGCPFAPLATGNVATEDVVWMFERMGISSGVDFRALLSVASSAASLPGAQVGGRVRNALAIETAARCSTEASPKPVTDGNRPHNPLQR